MRSYHFYFVPFLLLFLGTGCKKQSQNDPGDQSVLEGRWELVQSYSGMMPLTNYPRNSGNYMEYNGTDYKMYRNGQLIDQGTYQLSVEQVQDVNSCALVPASGNIPNTIVHSTGLKLYFEIAGKTMTTTSGCIPLDGGWSVYKK